jgi:hypothetical protein
MAPLSASTNASLKVPLSAYWLEVQVQHAGLMVPAIPIRHHSFPKHGKMKAGAASIMQVTASAGLEQVIRAGTTATELSL